MPYVLIHHKVNNIEELKSAFEEDSTRRRMNGCVGARLLRDPQDVSLYVGLLEFDDVENANRFAATERLRDLLGFIGGRSDVKPEVIEEYV